MINPILSKNNYQMQLILFLELILGYRVEFREWYLSFYILKQIQTLLVYKLCSNMLYLIKGQMFV